MDKFTLNEFSTLQLLNEYAPLVVLAACPSIEYDSATNTMWTCANTPTANASFNLEMINFGDDEDMCKSTPALV